jgi:hypothetical protein
MTTFRPKLWTGVSAAILLSALAACSEGGEAGEAGEAGPAAAVGEGGEGGAEGGAGAGEAGAQSAYTAVPADSRVALRLAHLKGFVLAAQKQTDPAQASALIGQGMTEVYDAQPGAFETAGLDTAALKKAAETGAAADITAALTAIETAQGKAKRDDAAVVKGLVNISAGLYRGVVAADGGVDAVEYQHAMGAALAAQQIAAASADAKVKTAKADIDKLVALFPGATAPEKPTPVGELSAQASRVELALS